MALKALMSGILKVLLLPWIAIVLPIIGLLGSLIYRVYHGVTSMLLPGRANKSDLEMYAWLCTSLELLLPWAFLTWAVFTTPIAVMTLDPTLLVASLASTQFSSVQIVTSFMDQLRNSQMERPYAYSVRATEMSQLTPASVYRFLQGYRALCIAWMQLTYSIIAMVGYGILLVFTVQPSKIKAHEGGAVRMVLSATQATVTLITALKACGWLKCDANTDYSPISCDEDPMHLPRAPPASTSPGWCDCAGHWVKLCYNLVQQLWRINRALVYAFAAPLMEVLAMFIFPSVSSLISMEDAQMLASYALADAMHMLMSSPVRNSVLRGARVGRSDNVLTGLYKVPVVRCSESTTSWHFCWALVELWCKLVFRVVIMAVSALHITLLCVASLWNPHCIHERCKLLHYAADACRVQAIRDVMVCATKLQAQGWVELVKAKDGELVPAAPVRPITAAVLEVLAQHRYTQELGAVGEEVQPTSRVVAPPQRLDSVQAASTPSTSTFLVGPAAGAIEWEQPCEAPLPALSLAEASYGNIFRMYNAVALMAPAQVQVM